MKEQTLEDELTKLEQKLYDIEDFIESLDYDSLTDEEKVRLQTIKLIIDGTVKMARD